MTIDGRPAARRSSLPVVQYGKVALMPQPARGWGEDREKMYHAKDLAPPHQYVAGYAWLRNGFKADAVVHVGTHGTLEWLDGKDIGLSSRRRARRADRRHPRPLHLQRGRRGRRAGGAAPRHGDAGRSHGAAVQEGRPAAGALGAEREHHRLREAPGRQPASWRAPTPSASAAAHLARHRQGSRAEARQARTALTEEVLHEIEEHLLAAQGPEHPLRPAHLRPRAGQAGARHAPWTRSSASIGACCRTRPRSSPPTWTSASSPRARASSIG